MPTNQERVTWFVKNEWRTGRIPHPKTLPCVFCSNPATEYHHYLGHEKEHWLDIQAVCRLCHYKQDKAKQKFLLYRGQQSSILNKMRAFIALHQKEFEKFCQENCSAGV